MPIGYLCQWISYAVFAVGSACCVPVSHADVLTRLLFRRSVLFFSGGCRFPADLIFPLGKVTVVLFYNAFHFSESPHKNLYIGITVLFERVGDFIQPVGNLCFGFFDFYFQRFSLFDFEKPLCIGKLLFQLRQNFVLLEVKEKDRTYYEVYSLSRSEEVPEGTRNYPLSALDLTGHLKHRVQWRLCAGQQEKRWRDWRISTSICSDTLIQAICSQTVQPLKMCRNFSDTLMSVPQ